MTFRVEFTQLAAGKYRKLDKKVKERIARKLDDAAGDPKRFLSRLSSVEAYKLRVREYRVILDVDWDLKRLIVLTLGHRSTIYR
ncbi:MAG: type II toxin-antitoxin system RelE/ParE family toxin [Methanobacteriota archaeon]|nr:MAG: type II toxin-antitoxin system RelE/ParE family toxin [Euryarchaeota archaeon]